MVEDDVPTQFYLHHYEVHEIQKKERKKEGYLSPDTMMV